MAMAAARVPLPGGRGKKTSQDLVLKLRKKGLSDERVRAKLSKHGFKKARISQLMKATSTSGVSSPCKNAKTSRDLVHKLHNQGRSHEQVRARLRIRGLKKSRISQLMTAVLASKAAMKHPGGSCGAGTDPLHQPAKSAQKATGRGDSCDIEKLVESEMNKRACALLPPQPSSTGSGRSHRSHTVMASRRAKSCVHPGNRSKRKQTATREPLDVDDIVHAHLRKMKRSTSTLFASAPYWTRRVVNDGARASGTDAESNSLPQAHGSSSTASPERSVPGSDEVMSAAARIHATSKHHFSSEADWAFAILAQPARDVPSTQRAYRALMRRLHPDKAGSHPLVVAAVDLLREATGICERSLCQGQLPGVALQLRCSCLCAEKGKRQMKLVWSAPQTCDSTPVHRYIVAVSDPSFGKILTIATLEPDYSQELKRYLAFDAPELCTYVVTEEHLKKMPKLFKADMLTVHVASGNRAGQSDWSTLEICLHNLQPSGLSSLADSVFPHQQVLVNDLHCQ